MEDVCPGLMEPAARLNPAWMQGGGERVGGGVFAAENQVSSTSHSSQLGGQTLLL